VGPACAVTVAIPKDWSYKPDLSVVGPRGEAVAITVSRPTLVNSKQYEAFLDPDTCQEYTESWDVPFLVYTITPHPAWPAHGKLRVRLQNYIIGDFRASDAESSCAAPVSPQMGMCGSGGPAPVEGCPKTTSSPTSPSSPPLDLDTVGGCSVASGGQSTALLSILLLGLVVLARRRANG